MSKKSGIRSALQILIPAVLFLLPACTVDPGHQSTGRDQNFNNSWLFLDSDAAGAEAPRFDDSGWRKVDLPHDWSVEDFKMQDSVHSGPFNRMMENGHDVGYLRGGTGWYRKAFNVLAKDRKKEVILNFDGVQSEATLYVNGKEAGNNLYGYTPFHINITPFLKRDGQPEVIAVKVFKPEQNSRWFTGAGIYRKVTISFLDPVHIAPHGVAVTSALSGTGKAEITLNLMLENSGKENTDVSIQAAIVMPGDSGKVTTEKNISVPGDGSSPVTLTLSLPHPELWDIDHPALYMADISVLKNGKKTDGYTTSFGIRTIGFSAEEGFLLNGKSVLLKGACMHHDNGLLGAATFRRAEERRVQIMKKNGYNAIRTSHNPPSEDFLDACDREGMLVIDEAFDSWIKAKRPNDYHIHFAESWKRDLDAMIMRDRNHPSIIMWSIGNEIQERSDSSGLSIARNLIEAIRSIDTTRPVTEAVCEFWDNPGKSWDYSANAFSVLDIGGYNYQWKNYKKDHEKYPARLMVGTESVPKEAYENWKLVEEEPYVIGDFVWTGWDYLGESGIGHATWQSDKNAPDPFAMPWPWYISNCGDIDILGGKKPQSYFRDVVWGESKLELAVHEPAPGGKEEVVFFWGWPQEVQSWNWKGHEGKRLVVSVYSIYPRVRLELNGTAIGEKDIPAGSGYEAVFDLPYQPGELTVSGIREHSVQETKSLRTTGPVAGIKFEPERKQIMADRGEIIYIDVTAVDSEGNLVPDSELPVTVETTGEGTLLAAGNASPRAEGSFTDSTFSLFRGKGMVIIRSSGKKGTIRAEGRAPGVGPVVAEVTAVEKEE